MEKARDRQGYYDVIEWRQSFLSSFSSFSKIANQIFLHLLMSVFFLFFFPFFLINRSCFSIFPLLLYFFNYLLFCLKDIMSLSKPVNPPALKYDQPGEYVCMNCEATSQHNNAAFKEAHSNCRGMKTDIRWKCFHCGRFFSPTYRSEHVKSITTGSCSNTSEGVVVEDSLQQTESSSFEEIQESRSTYLTDVSSPSSIIIPPMSQAVPEINNPSYGWNYPGPATSGMMNSSQASSRVALDLSLINSPSGYTTLEQLLFLGRMIIDAGVIDVPDLDQSLFADNE